MKQSIRRIYIEITSRCNLNCSFCRTTERNNDMDPAFFADVLKQAKQITPYIYLHVHGEPLLHPAFEEIMNMCDQENMQVQLVTNGTLLAKYPDLYRHSSLRKISFSLQSIEYHSADPISYLKDILSFCEAASKQERPYCEIRFWRDDQLQMERTGTCLSWLQEHYTFTKTERPDNYRIMDHVYVDAHNMFAWPSVGEPLNSIRGTCYGGIRQIAVLSDGTVVPCCLDSQGDIPLGSLQKQSLDEILSSKRYTDLCHGFENRELTEDLCRKCTYRNRFDQKI